jgi:hypothetical protein
MATVNSLICFGGLNGKTVTFTDAGDIVNLTAHGLRNGSAVFFETTGSLPTGLSASTLYYARQGADVNKFTLHTSASGAIANTGQVTFTGTGSGTHTVKSSLIFTGADLSRYDSTRVYEGLGSWNTNRAGAGQFDIEVAELGEAFTETVSAQLQITIPSAQNLIVSKVNGIRSAAWHNGNHPEGAVLSLSLDAGYVLFASAGVGGAAMIKLARYRDTIDGITVMNTSGGSVGYGVDLDVLCTLRNSFVYCTRTLATGVNLRSAFAKAENNVFNGWATGAAAGSSQSGIVFQNNLVTKCTNGFSAASTVKGFWYNNISVGNTTNWPTQPTALEGASNNAGLTGEAWVTGAGSRITIATTDFANYANNDFYPASSSSPQVEAGVTPYGYVTDDVADRFRPDYMNGGAAVVDVGPFEFDHGYGPWPSTDERGIAFTGLLSGSKVKVFETGTDTEKFSTASSGTSETWSESVSGSITVDYTIQKAGYLPIRVTGITVTAGPSGVQSIPVSQVVARWYQASSGLTINTNCYANASTKKWGLTTTSTLQNLASYLLEQWIALGDTGEAYANKAFPLEANGPNSFTWLDGWEADLTTYADSITNLSRDGMRYLSSAGAVTASWAALLSGGVPDGKTVRYQQTDGGTQSNAENTGNIDQLIQIYGDATHGNFDRTGWLVLKLQGDGYDQAEADAVATYGTLEDQLYVVGLTPTANGIAAGTVTGITITDHGASPVTWNSKVFSITITDTASHSGEEIVQYVRGLNSFNYHDMVQTNGTEFKTVRGVVYGDTGATLKGVRVVQSDGTTSHADFNLHTADDGTTYVPPLPPAAAEATVLADSRVQLYNVTTDTEIDNVFVTGTSYSYVITTEASDGDVLRLRACKLGRVSGEAFAVWGASGATFLISQPEDEIYTTWGIDGSTVTEFTGDVTGHIYIDANDLDGVSTKTRLGAWYSWVLTTEIGIRHFFGAVTYVSSAAIRVNVDVADILIENVNASTALRFTDLSVRLYRSDGSSIIAPTSYSIHNDYSGVPDVVETGVSGLTSTESNALLSMPGSVQIIEKVVRNKMITDPATGTLTLFDDDSVTPLLTADLFKDAAGATPYNGTGAERRERLA